MSQCLGCKWSIEIPEEYRLRPRDKFVINHSKSPLFFGHMIVMLKDHKPTRNISDLNQNEINEMLLLTGKIAKLLPTSVEEIAGLKVKMVYIATFSEDEAWHTHIHIIPKPYNIGPLGPKVFELPNVKLDTNQVKRLVDKLEVGLTDKN